MLEVDDGSGWIKIADPQGEKGLVPASYVELSKTETEGVSTPSLNLEPPSQDGRTYGKATIGHKCIS